MSKLSVKESRARAEAWVLLEKAETRDILSRMSEKIKADLMFNAGFLEVLSRSYAEAYGLKLNAILAPLRAAICGTVNSPGSIWHIMEILGKDECLYRLDNPKGIIMWLCSLEKDDDEDSD